MVITCSNLSELVGLVNEPQLVVFEDFGLRTCLQEVGLVVDCRVLDATPSRIDQRTVSEEVEKFLLIAVRALVGRSRLASRIRIIRVATSDEPRVARNW